jgi:hypothetical protein
MKKEIPTLFSTPMVLAILSLLKSMTRRLKGLEKINENPNDWAFIGLLHGSIKQKFQPVFRFENIHTRELIDIVCPYGKPGDLLFVRENWRMNMWDFEDGEIRIGYTDGDEVTFALPDDDGEAYDWMVKQFEKLVYKEIIRPVSDDEERMEFSGKKRPFSPSIHLPKWCSRIWLEVTDIRVERLWDITEQDAITEGIQYYQEEGCRPRYKDYEADASGYGHPEHDYPTVGVARTSFVTLWRKINGADSWDKNPWVWVISFKVLSTTGKPEEKEVAKHLV